MINKILSKRLILASVAILVLIYKNLRRYYPIFQIRKLRHKKVICPRSQRNRMKVSTQVCLTPKPKPWYCMPGTEVNTLHTEFILSGA